MSHPEHDLQDLLDRACQDPDLRARLLARPREVLESELGIELPEDADVRVIEERADQLHLILPAASSSERELADDELEAAAGGVFNFVRFRSFARRPSSFSIS